MSQPGSGLLPSQQSPLRHRSETPSMLGTRAMRSKRRHVGSRAIAFVGCKVVMRKALVKGDHVSVACCFGKDRSCAHFPNIGVRPRPGLDGDLPLQCPRFQVTRNVRTVDDDAGHQLRRQLLNCAKHGEHGGLQDVKAVHLFCGRRGDRPRLGATFDLGRKQITSRR